MDEPKKKRQICGELNAFDAANQSLADWNVANKLEEKEWIGFFFLWGLVDSKKMIRNIKRKWIIWAQNRMEFTIEYFFKLTTN